MSKSKQKTENAVVSGFKRKKAITLPTLKMVIDTPIYVTITKINIKQSKSKETGELKPLPVATVKNLVDGNQYEMVLGAALIGQFTENYAEEEINEKSFEITKHAKKTGKDYHTYTIYEIDPTEAA